MDNTTASEDRAISTLGDIPGIIERLDSELTTANTRIKELEDEVKSLKNELTEANERASG